METSFQFQMQIKSYRMASNSSLRNNNPHVSRSTRGIIKIIAVRSVAHTKQRERDQLLLAF